MQRLTSLLAWITLTILTTKNTPITAQNSPAENYFKIERDTQPCSPYDTINITSGTFNDDGTITHDGVTYKKQDYKTYDYMYINHEIKVEVDSHIRGCVCIYKPCIRYCCPLNKQYDVDNGTCISSDVTISTGFNVTISQYARESMKNFMDEESYEIFFNRPCFGRIYTTLATEKEWKLEETNNEVILVFKHRTLDYNHFCLTSEGSNVRAVYCATSKKNFGDDKEFPLGIFIASILLLTTSLFYLYFRELRFTLHDKYITSYIVSLTVMYLCSNIYSLYSEETLGSEAHEMLSFILFLSLLSSLIWLNIISLEIWQTLKTGVENATETGYKTYALISIGIPLAIILVPLYIAEVCSVPSAIQIIIVVLAVATAYLLPFLFIRLSLNIMRLAEAKEENETEIPNTLEIQHKMEIFAINLYIQMSSFVCTIIVCGLQYGFSELPNARIIVNLTAVIHSGLLFKLFIWRSKVKRLIFRNQIAN